MMEIKTAHALASLSRLVYLDESEVENGAQDLGYSEFAWFDTLDTQAGVFANDYNCVLAFRGTTDIGDWLTNMDVWKTSHPYGEVHHGFQEALDHVWSDIEPVLAQYSDRKLYITGHSLGAALATLAVAEWGSGTLYTFGSPRVGDERFARSFDFAHPSYRFVNNNDVVARVPMGGYEHVSSLRYFTHSGKMWAEPTSRWLTWDRFMGRIQRKVADGIKDHDMGDYVNLISKQDVNASWSGVSW